LVEPSDAAGMQFTDHLLHVGQRSHADRVQSGVIAHWQRAADAVRATSDLLATHLDTWGTTRAPESEVLNDPAVRAAGFGELACLAVPVAGAADALGLQPRDSGATLREVEHLVPGPARYGKLLPHHGVLPSSGDKAALWLSCRSPDLRSVTSI